MSEFSGFVYVVRKKYIYPILPPTDHRTKANEKPVALLAELVISPTTLWTITMHYVQRMTICQDQRSKPDRTRQNCHPKGPRGTGYGILVLSCIATTQICRQTLQSNPRTSEKVQSIASKLWSQPFPSTKSASCRHGQIDDSNGGP
jgi:hypothetical protein